MAKLKVSPGKKEQLPVADYLNELTDTIVSKYEADPCAAPKESLFDGACAVVCCVRWVLCVVCMLSLGLVLPHTCSHGVPFRGACAGLCDVCVLYPGLDLPPIRVPLSV